MSVWAPELANVDREMVFAEKLSAYSLPAFSEAPAKVLFALKGS